MFNKLSGNEMIRFIALALAVFTFRNTGGAFGFIAKRTTIMAEQYFDFIVDGKVAEDGEQQ